MSDKKVDSAADDVSQSVKDFADTGGKKIKQGIKSTARKLGRKAISGAVKMCGKVSIRSALSSTFLSLGLWVVIPFIVITFLYLFYIMYEDEQYATKTYSSLVESNTVKKENIRSFEERVSSVMSRTRTSSDEGSNLDISSNSFNTIELSEGNQAIENYHYYKSSESVLNNKMYISTKNIDTDKKDKELFDELIKKGVLENSGNEIFMNSNSLSEVESQWKNNYGGKNVNLTFKWSDNSVKKDLDSRVNSGISIKGFGDKYVGKIKEITDEKEKTNIKDAYGREEYFQLPEELLGVLNTKIYGSEYIYDDPFVQGVKFTYSKKKEESTNEDGKSVNKKSAENTYKAEDFNKYFNEGELKGKGNLFIKYAKKYDVDAALAVAIACKESDYGKNELATKNKNVFGVSKNSGKVSYDDIEEGIESGIKDLASKCIGKGLTSLEQIGEHYAMSSNKKWAEDISTIYKKITGKNYSKNKSGKGIGIDPTAFRSVPDYEFKLDSNGIEDNTSEYGLGSVFIYKPSINLEVKRGVEVNQVLKTSGEVKESKPIKTYEEDYKKGDSLEPVRGKTKDKDGNEINTITEYELIEKEVSGKKVKKKKVSIYKVTKEYEAVATANAIEDVKAEIVYVLDKVVTFAGVYEFEYELVSEEVGSENSVTEREVAGTGGLKEVDMIETKTIKMYEKPADVKSDNLSVRYMNKYLENFKGVVPRHIASQFNVNRMVKAFKGVKGSASDSSDSSSESTGVVSGYDNVEQWRGIVEEVAQEYGIDPNIIMVMILSESSGNVHNNKSNLYYWGLLSMGDDSIPKSLGGHDVYEYFDKNEITLDRGLMTDSRIPHCGTSGHNEAEHERAARFNIEYAVKRLGNTFYKHSKKMFNKEPQELTQDELFYVVAAGLCSYATGEGGQNSIRKVAGYDYAKLYSSPGTEYSKYHILADQIRGGDLNSKFGMNKYLKKVYENYSMFSGGVNYRDSAQYYDPDKWFVLDKNKNVSGEAASEGVTSSSNGTNMNPTEIKKYLEYEKYGKTITSEDKTDEENEENLKNAKKAVTGTVVAKKSSEESQNIRTAAIAMIKQKSSFDVTKKDENDVFWGEGFADKYFDEGLQARPLYGDALSEKTWSNKIRESTVYTGGTDGILNLARSYGKDVYMIVKRAVELRGTKYKQGKSGPLYFDHSGMLWYVFNSNSSKDYFGKGSVGEQYEKLSLEVSDNDIRPGDIIFYSNKSDKSDKPNKVGIYLGNKAYLGINEQEGELQISNYEGLRDNVDIDIKGIRRVIKYGSGENATISGLGGLPEDLISGDWIDPLYKATYSGSSNFGMRMHPILNTWKFHRGLDMAAATGQVVSAAKTGKVLKASMYSSYGNCVILDHGDGYTTLYAHLSSISVSQGDIVNQGDEIGKVGSTGRSTGPHLHFEIAYKAPGHVSAKEGVYPAGNYLDPRTVIKTIKR